MAWGGDSRHAKRGYSAAQKREMKFSEKGRRKERKRGNGLSEKGRGGCDFQREEEWSVRLRKSEAVIFRGRRRAGCCFQRRSVHVLEGLEAAVWAKISPCFERRGAVWRDRERELWEREGCHFFQSPGCHFFNHRAAILLSRGLLISFHHWAASFSSLGCSSIIASILRLSWCFPTHPSPHQLHTTFSVSSRLLGKSVVFHVTLKVGIFV